MKLSLITIRLMLIVVFGLISYSLTGSIAVRSTMGIILAIVSLSATIVFVYLLPKLYEEPNEKESSEG